MPVLIGGVKINIFPNGDPCHRTDRLLKGGGSWTRTWLLSFLYKKYSETQFGISHSRDGFALAR
jgi:hypothetical protein